MKSTLTLSDAAYGFGAGLFFVTYFLLEVPSNLLLARFGPRRWMARIMITWGVLSSATMFVRGEYSFYALRLALVPPRRGSSRDDLYLTYWFPPRERAAAVAASMTAIGCRWSSAGRCRGPSWTASRAQRMGGLAVLFLWRGLPSMRLGLVVLRVLPTGRRGGLAHRRREGRRGGGAPRRAASAAHATAARCARHSATTGCGLLAAFYSSCHGAVWGLTLWSRRFSDTPPTARRWPWAAVAIPYAFRRGRDGALGAVHRSPRRLRATRHHHRRRGLALAAAALLLDSGPTVTLVASASRVMASSRRSDRSGAAERLPARHRGRRGIASHPTRSAPRRLREPRGWSASSRCAPARSRRPRHHRRRAACWRRSSSRSAPA